MYRKWPLPFALFWIVFSLFLVTGTIVKTTRVVRADQQKRVFVSALIQTGPEKEALKTVYLAEILGLSWDIPELLDTYDVKGAEEKLRASPLIASAHVSKQVGGSLLIDYAVRKPLFWLADYENLAVDQDGFLFPVSPFFSPKELPELYYGASPFKGWKSRLQGKKFDLACQILNGLQKTAPGFVRRIDVSEAFAQLLGNCQVVLVLEEKGRLHYLRLSSKNFKEELLHYQLLRHSLAGEPMPELVDLRIPNLLFYK